MAAGPLLLAGAFALAGPISHTDDVAMAPTADGLYTYVTASDCRRGFGTLVKSGLDGSNLHVAGVFALGAPGSSPALAAALCGVFR